MLNDQVEINKLVDTLHSLCKGLGVHHHPLRERLGVHLCSRWGIEPGDDPELVRRKAIWQLEPQIERLPTLDLRKIARVSFNIADPSLNISDPSLVSTVLTDRRKWLESHHGIKTRFAADKNKELVLPAIAQWILDSPPRPGPIESATTGPRSDNAGTPQADEQTSVPAASRKVEHQISKPPLIVNNKRRWPLIVACGVLGATLLAVGAVVVPRFLQREQGEPRSSSSPATNLPFSITTQTDPLIANSNLGISGPSWLFPEEKMRSLPAPDDVGCQSWFGWAHRNGGLDISTAYVSLNITPLTPVTVQIVGSELEIERLPGEATGAVVDCPVGGPSPISRLGIDLDKQTMVYSHQNNATSDGFPMLVRPFALSVEYNKPERIDIVAGSEACYCRWALILHIQVGAERFRYRVDDNGTGFITAPRAGKYVSYKYDYDGKVWCRQPCE